MGVYGGQVRVGKVRLGGDMCIDWYVKVVVECV